MDNKILLLDNSEVDREKMKYIISELGKFEIIDVASFNEINSIEVSLACFSLIIIEINFPTEKDSFSLISAIRSNAETKTVPIIVIAKPNNPQIKSLALKYSVNDYIEKPVNPTRLQSSIRSLVRIEAKFKYIVNETAKIIMSFEEYFAKELYMAKRTKQHLSIVLITLVKPKEEKLLGGSSNYIYSMQLKEKAYTTAIDKVKQSLRVTDYAILNNKDIIIVLPNTNMAGAKVVDTKITAKIDTSLCEFNLKFNDLFFSTTVTYPEEGSDFQSLMNAAIKKVSDKEMLEKFTNILDNTKQNVSSSYTRYKKYDPRKY
ncbi:response regulator [Pseudobacteroides cellulosolvens]|uniref:Stage 0 sporulation protein A homolog n=1 Tax=Pseudobacteroides cellulosolvens ATCC 35603 = DSM 2933 TaxID=398512 RepID=A0A0L6JSA4_9FIRM|nr:response regulator [Pseudobacteroides cellulosolvens]KNY28605.1 response regulator receiver protein [Pseudobacteroides cellulosolvens ATCC 35603 = DSM 2933]